MCVLQVFQAPEFYMRGVTGAYAVTDLVNGTYPIGQALWSLVQGPKWEHWIFVMGETTEYGWVDSRLFSRRRAPSLEAEGYRYNLAFTLS